MANLETLTQKISLQVEAGKPMVAGLDETQAGLKAVLDYVQKIDAAINKVSTGAAFKRTAAEFSSQIKTTGGQSTAALAKAFGFSPEQATAYGAQLESAIRAQVRKLEMAMEGLNRTTPKGRESQAWRRASEQLRAEQAKLFFTSGTAETLKSPAAAGKFFEQYSAQLARQSGVNRRTLRALLTGGGPGVGGGGGAGAAGVAGVKVTGGQIVLEIPASQIKAVVVGDVVATGGGVARGEGGRFVSGAGGSPSPQSSSPGRGGAKGGGGGGGGGIVPNVTANELQRVVATRGEDVKTTITELDQIGETVTRTYDELGEEITKRVRTRHAAPILEKVKQQKAAYLAAMAGAGTSPLSQASAKEGAAAALMRILRPKDIAALKAQGISGPQTMLSSRATILTRQASALREKHFMGAVPIVSPDSMYKNIAGVYGERQKRLDNASALGFTAGEEVSDQEMQRITNLRGRQQRIFSRAQRAAQTEVPPVIGGIPPIIPPAGGGGRGFGQGRRHWAQGFQPGQYAQNVATVAGWAAAVYPVMMARQALESLAEKSIEVQTQMARLENVFRGTGGSAVQLTGDILKLAAANGVDSVAAMDTATAWARLGLSRSQVVTATRQTAILSNTGQMPADEAQRYLASLMSNYKFGTRDLGNVVSMLTTTTGRTGIPQRDLLAGMAKAAPLASAGGMGMAELMGIIAQAARRSGDTGMQAGNSLRAIFTNLREPNVQEYLYRQFGIEPLNQQGQTRSLSETMGKLYTAYAGSSRDERGRMAMTVAGRLRGSRFEAMMQGYPEAERSAIDSLMNPDAGAMANERMKQTLGYAWQGWKSEAAQIVARGLNAPASPVGGMTEGQTIAEEMRSVQNVAHLLTSGAAGKYTGFLGAMGTGALGGAAAGSFIPGVGTAWGAGLGATLGGLLSLSGPIAHMINMMTDPEGTRAAGFSDAAERQRSLAMGEGQKRRFLMTMREALPRMHGEEQTAAAQVAASYLPEGERGSFMGSLSRGTDYWRTALTRTAGQSDLEAAGHLRQEAAARQAEVAQLDARIRKERSHGEDTADDEEKRNEALGKTVSLMESIDDLESREGYDARRQEVLDFLKERKDLVEGILNLSQQMPQVGALGQVYSQRIGLQGQETAVGQALHDLNGAPFSGGAEAERARTELTNLQEQIRAQLHSAQTGPELDLARLSDSRRVAEERARGFAQEAGDIGHTPLEQMMNRGRAVGREIDTLFGMPNRSDMQSARLAELMRDRYENRVGEAHRTEELPYLIEQNRRESQRRFSREALFAGPQELMQRIGIMRLAASNNGRGIGPGQFFALSPELRRMYDEEHGGEEGARLREEAQLAREHNTALTPEQEAAEGRYTATDIAHVQRGMNGPTDAIGARLAAAAALQARVATATETNNTLMHQNNAELHELTAEIRNLRTGGGGQTVNGAPVGNPNNATSAFGGQALGLPANFNQTPTGETISMVR